MKKLFLTLFVAALSMLATAHTVTVYSQGCTNPNTMTNVPDGASIQIEAVSLAGQEFTQWNDGNTENPRLVSGISSDSAFKAIYAPLYDGHDVITYDMLSDEGEESEGYQLLADKTMTSGATYTVYADIAGGSMKFINGVSDIVTTTSGGRIKSVTVDWASGNTSTSKMIVYGSHSPYPNDGIAEWEAMGTQIATITYPATQALNLNSYKYEYVMVIGGSEPKINSIDFEWMTVADYPITVGSHTNGTISLSHTSAEPGQQVTITFTGNKSRGGSYELRSYTIDGETVDLEESEYAASKVVTFAMKDHEVEVSAVFAMAPSRTDNAVTVNPCEELAGTVITITSGGSFDFTYTADYVLGYIDESHGAYTGNVTTKASNSSNAVLSNHTYNPSTGQGSFTLTAYNQDSSTLSFSTVQTNDYQAGTVSYTIKVVPRNVMMVTEYNGVYYAVVNSLDVSKKLAAQEVKVINGTVYVLSGSTYTQAQMTWKVCTKADGTYTIQNSSNQYLGFSPSSPATMTLSSSVYNWYKYEDAGQLRFYNNGNEIVYYNYNSGHFADYPYDKCADNALYSHGAFELGKVATATEQTIRTDLTAGKFSTVCLPYSFIPAEGLSVYDVDNYEEKNSAYYFYFCRHDEGDVTNAGQPYIVKSTSNALKVYQIGNENASAGDYRGLYGTMEKFAWSSVWGAAPYTLGNVLVINTNGEIKYANGKGGLLGDNGGRAYLLLDEIPTTSECGGTSVSGAPRRVVLSTEETQEPEVATDLEELNSAALINWNEPVYNMLGQRVGRGTRGVLLQNGQKFIEK